MIIIAMAHPLAHELLVEQVKPLKKATLEPATLRGLNIASGVAEKSQSTRPGEAQAEAYLTAEAPEAAPGLPFVE
jgi:hypothetical protein